MSNPVQCPSCDGTGGGYGFVDGRDPETGKRWGGVRWCECDVCKGAKWVTPEKADAYAAGRAMRHDRVARGVSLHEEAKRLGITALELSRRERGATE